MEKLVLRFIGVDSWSRPVFEDEHGQLFKDTNCGNGRIVLCTVYGGFEGIPDTPISCLEKYKNVEVEIIGMENEPAEEEKFNYQMLDRLRMDCEYYLGNGNRNKKHLWAENEIEQIAEMKKIWNGFSDDKKPEWLSWQDILDYEIEMVGWRLTF